MTTSVTYDLTRVAALPGMPGAGNVQRLEPQEPPLGDEHHEVQGLEVRHVPRGFIERWATSLSRRRAFAAIDAAESRGEQRPTFRVDAAEPGQRNG